MLRVAAQATGAAEVRGPSNLLAKLGQVPVAAEDMAPLAAA